MTTRPTTRDHANATEPSPAAARTIRAALLGTRATTFERKSTSCRNSRCSCAVGTASAPVRATQTARIRIASAAAGAPSNDARGAAQIAMTEDSSRPLTTEMVTTVGPISSASRSARATAEATPRTARSPTRIWSAAASAKIPSSVGDTMRATTARTRMLPRRRSTLLAAFHSAPVRTRLPSAAS